MGITRLPRIFADFHFDQISRLAFRVFRTCAPAFARAQIPRALRRSVDPYASFVHIRLEGPRSPTDLAAQKRKARLGVALPRTDLRAGQGTTLRNVANQRSSRLLHAAGLIASREISPVRGQIAVASSGKQHEVGSTQEHPNPHQHSAFVRSRLHSHCEASIVMQHRCSRVRLFL